MQMAGRRQAASQGTEGNIISRKERAEAGQMSRSGKVGQCYEEAQTQRQKA